MTYHAPPSVHRWALRALLLSVVALCAFGFVAAELAGASPASAVQAEPDPSATTSTVTPPSPDPTTTETATPSPTPTPAPAHAEASLVRSACDTVRLSARTDAVNPFAYRITDEAGRVAASGIFTGSMDAVLPVSTGHTYTAHVSEAPEGQSLATSSAADLREPCPVAVTADAPQFEDQCGTERDTVLVPRIIGVDYRVGQLELAPGASPAHGAVTVEAAARPGYALNGPSRWTHSFGVDPCPSALPPAAGAVTPAPLAPEPEPAAAPPTTATPEPTVVSPSSATSPVVGPTAESTPPRTAEPSSQTGVAAPGPLAWGIMIALAVAGGIFFWSKTRH